MGLGDFVSGIFGSKNETHVDAPQINSADYQAQYGGGQGSVGRQDQLSKLGAAGANYGNTNGMQGMQAQALGLDMAAAQGNAPSVAQNQLQQGLAQSQAQAASMAAGARGGGANLAAAQNQAASTQAAQSAQANNESAQLRASEMATARGQAGDLATQGLGQQIGMSQFDASLQQGYEGQANQVAANQLNAGMQFDAQNSANQLGAAQINAQAAGQNAGTNQSNGGFLVGMGASAAGGLATSSDVRGKTDIQPEGGAFAMGSQPPVVVVDSSRAIDPRDDRSSLPATVPTMGADTGTQAYSPGAAAIVKGPAPSIEAQKKANDAIAQALSGPPGQQAQQSSFQQGQAAGTELAGAAKGIGSALGSLSDYNAKANVAGEGAVALRESHTANEQKFAPSMRAEMDLANAQPWTNEASAAQANLNHIMFTSDKNAKTATKREGLSAREAKALAQLEGDVDAEKARGESPDYENAIEYAIRTRGQKEPPRPGGTTNVDRQMDVQHPVSFDYIDPRENGGARRHGVIAQDVATGPAGPDIVKETPKGLVLSIPSAVSSTMAQTGRLNERQTATEQKLAALLGDDTPVQPAGEVNLSPTLAPQNHYIASVYDGETPVGSLTSDARAKKNARDEGYVQGAAAAAQHLAPDMVKLAAPGYTVPAVMSDEQRARVLAATDRGRELEGEGVTPEEIQRHIDMAMQPQPVTVPTVAPTASTPGTLPPPSTKKAPRGYAPSMGAMVLARRGQ